MSDSAQPAANRRPAVIVDMDGTLCDVSTVIHLQAEPDGFAAFHQGCSACPAYKAVVDWCIEQHGRGNALLIVTGRDAWAHELTVRWLAEHLPAPLAGVHMRGEGDSRSNVDVKRDILRRLMVHYDIRAAVDDDPEIVALWQAFGIPVAVVLDEGELIELGVSFETRPEPSAVAPLDR